MTSRGIHPAAAYLLAVEAVVVGLIVAIAQPLLLPVTADLSGGITLTAVNLGIAIVVLLVFAALCRGAAVLWPTPVIRWVEWSQVSGVTVFLVAQLNGIRDVATLVALYALAAGATLFLVLHERAGAGRWPFALGAAVGIVPWGVIAFYQIGAIAMGDSPGPLIRVITVGMVAVAVAYWLATFHHRRAGWAHPVLIVISVSVFAWLIVGLLNQ
jgi:Heliorhodopsin